MNTTLFAVFTQDNRHLSVTFGFCKKPCFLWRYHKLYSVIWCRLFPLGINWIAWEMVRADFYNPLSQFIVKATAPVLNPLRRIIPGLFGIDIASLLLAYCLQYIENMLLFSVRGLSINPVFLLWHSIGSLLTLLLYILSTNRFCIWYLFRSNKKSKVGICS